MTFRSSDVPRKLQYGLSFYEEETCSEVEGENGSV